MFGRMRTRPLIAGLTVGFQVLFASAAMAHHTTITATAVCSDGAPVINYTSTSWSPNAGEGENTRIDILFNGVVVGSGAYVYPANSFSGSAPAPTSGPVTVTALAVDSWGNGAGGLQSASTSVSVPTDCPQPGLGRFTGGGFQLRVGAARVTRGLTVHCDLLLSNNLEVNWGGNQFHMTEHLTTIVCSDDPEIVQAPPPAPLDTLVGVGTGRYNGVDGYTIEFTFVDGGEPGTSDKAALRIYQTANPGNVVLNIPLRLLDGGNLQAHYDQPHK
jgi:hypothetical protein